MSWRTSKPGEPADFNWSRDELALLQAARADVVPQQIEQRMRTVLEGQLAQSTAVSSTASVRGTGLFGSKLVLWGTLSLLALGSFAYLGAQRRIAGDRQATSASSHALSQPSAATRVVRPSPSVAQPVAASVVRSSPDAPLVAAETAADSASVARSTVAPSLQRKAAAVRAVSSIEGGVRVSQPTAATEVEQTKLGEPAQVGVDQLRLEAELLNAARKALGQGALVQAGRLLDRYAQEFEHGVLYPESDVLRIEWQMRRGEPEAAKARASRFLAEYPRHPLRERVQALSAVR